MTDEKEQLFYEGDSPTADDSFKKLTKRVYGPSRLASD